MVDRDELSDLRRLLVALEPYLDRLLIIGGWAHRLYRFLDDVAGLSYDPIFTTDTDVAIPSKEALPKDALLGRLHEQGFVEEFRGDDKPPITHYHLGSADSQYYVEFLTPLLRGRRGKETDTVVVGGVVAQALNHLDILMIEPWSVLVTDPASRAGFKVSVPNPSAYIAQKLVVLKDRIADDDKAKDILYVHDTLELFGPRLDVLERTWHRAVKPRMGESADEVVALAERYFSVVTDDIRRAVRVASRRQLDPETLRVRCEIGLDAMLSD